MTEIHKWKREEMSISCPFFYHSLLTLNAEAKPVVSVSYLATGLQVD